MTRLALMNHSKNRKKAFITVLFLSLTGILLLCICGFANSEGVNEMAQSQFGDNPYFPQYEDYAGQKFVKMQKENSLCNPLLETLAAIPGVAHITAYSARCLEIPAISAIPGNQYSIALIIEQIFLAIRILWIPSKLYVVHYAIALKAHR